MNEEMGTPNPASSSSLVPFLEPESSVNICEDQANDCFVDECTVETVGATHCARQGKVAIELSPLVVQAIRDWCQTFSRKDLALLIKSKNLETSTAKRKRTDKNPAKYSEVEIEKEISKVDEAGNIIVNKSIAETYILFWSKKLNMLNQEAEMNLEIRRANEQVLTKTKEHFNDQLKALEIKLTNTTKLKESYRLQLYRRNNNQKQKDSRDKNKRENKNLLSFVDLEKRAQQKRIERLRKFLLENIVGYKTKSNRVLSFSEREQILENEIKPAILKLVPYSKMKKQFFFGTTKRLKKCTMAKCRRKAQFCYEGEDVASMCPDHKLSGMILFTAKTQPEGPSPNASEAVVSPLNCNKLLKKIPQIRRALQVDLDETLKKRKADMDEKCKRWFVRRISFVSIDTARQVSESNFVKSANSKKRTVRVSKVYASECGLKLRDFKSAQTKEEDSKIRDHIRSNFCGKVPMVQTCSQLIPKRHGFFNLVEYLAAIFDSYKNSFPDQYRVQFYDEKTGAIIPNVNHVKVACDGCTRMSCGAAATGGDIKITNIVLQLANYPFSIGHNDHGFLAACMNCGENDVWVKLVFYLWERALSPLKSKRNGSYLIHGEETIFWGNGDMKMIEQFYCNGGSNCDMGVGRFQVLLSMLNCTAKLVIESFQRIKEASAATREINFTRNSDFEYQEAPTATTCCCQTATTASKKKARTQIIMDAHIYFCT